MLPLLCVAAAAVLTGARSLIAIGEWLNDAPQSVLDILGFPADPLTGIRPSSRSPPRATKSPHSSPCWTAWICGTRW